MERALITKYETDMAQALIPLRPDTADAARALAELPLQVRGFGPVKARAVAAVLRRAEIVATQRAPSQARAAKSSLRDKFICPSYWLAKLLARV